MAEAFVYKPYPQIPVGHFPSETPAVYPTPTTTLLFNHLEKFVMANEELLKSVESGRIVIPSVDSERQQEGLGAFRLLSNWLTAKNSAARRTALNNLVTYSKEDPQNADFILAFSEAQQASIDPFIQANCQELYQQIESEVKPPLHARIHFIFRPHLVESKVDFIASKFLLKQTLLGFFKKEEENIFIYENTKGESQSYQRRFNEGVQKFRSFIKAELYASGTPEEDIEREYNDQQRTDNFSHTFLVFDTLDELLSEGYRISAVSEPGFENSQIDDSVKHIRSIEAFKKYYYAIRDEANQRNKLILKLLADLIQKYAGKRVNIAGEFGSYHSAILSNMSSRMRAVTTSVEYSYTPVPNMTRYDVLNRKLAHNEPITEELWEAARQEEENYYKASLR